jgi:dTDP-4-amino-4,6-dideoxygalactose transaminase
VYYPIPLHRQEVFAEEYRSLSFPVAESVAGSCFSLPIFPEMTDTQVEVVVAAVKKALS